MNPLIQNYLKHLEKQVAEKPLVFSPQDIQTAWFSVGKIKNDGYVFDEVAKTMFPYLLKPDNRKGICFCGSKGIGKTLNLDIFAKLNTDLYKTPTEVWEVMEIEIQYKATGAGLLERIGSLQALVINDVGIESKTLNDYGTNRNLIADLLYIRYRAFQVNGYKTFISTNLKWETLQAHYGSRLTDRMNEMFIPVELKGETRRK